MTSSGDGFPSFGWLWLCTTLFVVYCGALPFHFTSDVGVALAKLSRVSLNPLVSPDTGRRPSMPDVVQNVVLFLPFGLMGGLTLRHWSSSAIRRAAVIGAAGAIVSVGIEILQLFTPDRTTSLTDVMTDTLGASIGALGTEPVVSRAARVFGTPGVRRLVTVPSFYPVAIGIVILCVAAWEPFDATLDVGDLMAKWRAVRSHPWYVAEWSDVSLGLLRYGIFSLTLTLYLRQLGARSPSRLAMIVGAVGGIGLTGSQMLIQSRMPGLVALMACVAGAGAGAVLARGWPHGRGRRFWFVMLAASTALAGAPPLANVTSEVQPGHLITGGGVPDRHPQGAEPERDPEASLRMVRSAVEPTLAFLPLGFALTAIVRLERRLFAAAAAWGLFVAGVSMALGLLLFGARNGATTVLFAVWGSVVGAGLGAPGERVAQKITIAFLP